MSEPKKPNTTQKPAEKPVTPKAASRKAEKPAAAANKGKGTTKPAKEAKAPETPPAKPALPQLTKVEPTKPATPPGTPQQPTPPARPGLPASPPASPTPFPTPRPPTGLFGNARPNARVTWEIIPTHDVGVRIDVSKSNIDIFKLLGIQAPKVEDLQQDAAQAYWGPAIAGVPANVAQVISDFLDVNPAADTALKAKLEAAWAALGFTGAAIIHNWREEARVAFATRLEAIHKPVVVLRATDPLLILNILSRVRSGALIANMPTELEKPFLERQLFTDDARVVAWVRTSGAVEEMLVEHAKAEEPSEE
jgi:hypothetical protein